MTVQRIENLVKELIGKDFNTEPVPEDRYTKMHWPRLLPLMRFKTERFRIPGFGYVTFLRTKAIGFVRMLTCSLVPGEGASVPYLMIEVMEVKGKCTVFVEYYDCTADGADVSELAAVAEKYASLEDYPEKPAWYIEERTNGSMSKIALDDSIEKLIEMVCDSASVYLNMAALAPKVPGNAEGLIRFAERMVNEGNPLSETFNKVLGPDETKVFFRTVVMPVPEGPERM